jgi:hypothetical protein
MTWWIGVAIFILVGVAVIHAGSYEFSSKLFPWAIGFSILFLTLIHTILGLFQREDKSHEDAFNPGQVWDALKILGVIISILLLIWVLGLKIATPLTVFILILYYHRKLRVAIAMGLAFFCFIYFVLDMWLHIHFPVPLLYQLVAG